MRRRINVTSPFPRELEYRARVTAAMRGISRSALIREAVRCYLRQVEVMPADTKQIRFTEGGQRHGD